MKALPILSVLVLAAAGCREARHRESPNQKAVLEAIGEVSRIETGLPFDLRQMVVSYVEKEQIKIRLAAERDPGRIAVMSAELTETSAKHLKEVAEFEEGCAKVEKIARATADWTTEERESFGKYSSPAVETVATLRANRWEAIRAADIYLAAVRSGDGISEAHSWYLEALGELTRYQRRRAPQSR